MSPPPSTVDVFLPSSLYAVLDLAVAVAVATCYLFYYSFPNSIREGEQMYIPIRLSRELYSVLPLTLFLPTFHSRGGQCTDSTSRRPLCPLPPPSHRTTQHKSAVEQITTPTALFPLPRERKTPLQRGHSPSPSGTEKAQERFSFLRPPNQPACAFLVAFGRPP